MNVLLINGSPHEKGCTYTALAEVAAQLERHGIQTRFFHIGNRPMRGCLACGRCKDGFCAFDDDGAVECAKLMREADGIVVGSPVYYAGPNGVLTSLLDRVFFCGSSWLVNKPAAVVVSARRGGASATYDRLLKYFMKTSMPIVTSQYWNSVHGMTPEDVRQDKEGLQTMRTLANNMAWLLKCIDHAKGVIPLPENEPWTPTNFIR
jgi:multimeric flavodoxin WrbA